MPKYLIQGSYTAEGVKGLTKDGGSKRRAAAEEAIRSLGGKLEAFYYAFGETDVFAIVELPDHSSAAAMFLTLGASGAFDAKTTVLFTPEEMDQATRKPVSYRPPGR